MTREEIISMAAGDNADAERFLTVFVDFAHTLDDVIDRDHEVADATLLRSVMEWTHEVATNPFFREHHAALLPVITLSVNAWLDSNRWVKRADPRERLAADVLKGMYHEVVHLVAHITGGWDNLRALTTVAREYDFETGPDAPAAK